MSTAAHANQIRVLGMYLAEAHLFISIAMTLAAFNISKAVENGQEITPPVDYVSGTISCVACLLPTLSLY